MRRSKSSLWWRDSNKLASGKTGAVHDRPALFIWQYECRREGVMGFDALLTDIHV
jgi:hypothetical protein